MCVCVCVCACVCVCVCVCVCACVCVCVCVCVSCESGVRRGCTLQTNCSPTGVVLCRLKGHMDQVNKRKAEISKGSQAQVSAS